MHILVATARQVGQHDLVFRQGGRQLGRVGQRVRRFQGRDDAFDMAAVVEGLQRFVVGDRDVLRAARVFQPGMFRADAGVIQPCADREALQNLPIRVLQQIGAVAMQHAGAPAGQAGAMLHPVIHALAASLDPDDSH